MPYLSSDPKDVTLDSPLYVKLLQLFSFFSIQIINEDNDDR